MDKLTMLFIRACKATIRSNDNKRVESVYRRLYLMSYNREVNREVIISILAKICTDYNLITISGLIDTLNSNNAWKYGKKDGEDFRLELLASIIRFSPVSKFPGLISPCRFRRND